MAAPFLRDFAMPPADESIESSRGSAPCLSRRHFVGLTAASTVAVLIPLYRHRPHALLMLGMVRPDVHPDPRPGIDGSNVLTADQLANAPHLIDVFDQIREIPHIADGILCYCGCAHLDGYRSLLSCYEKPGMAQFCEICEGQGRIAYRRWKEGQTLDQIRRATDARYGPEAGAESARAGVQHSLDHA
ncbi:MAG: hypothetical protein KFH98_08510 [Gemmatimonadetes bacterium]|nr:hypothetical protein [Gemmatimonadota bacterium]